MRKFFGVQSSDAISHVGCRALRCQWRSCERLLCCPCAWGGLGELGVLHPLLAKHKGAVRCGGIPATRLFSHHLPPVRDSFPCVWYPQPSSGLGFSRKKKAFQLHSILWGMYLECTWPLLLTCCSWRSKVTSPSCSLKLLFRRGNEFSSCSSVCW